LICASAFSLVVKLYDFYELLFIKLDYQSRELIATSSEFNLFCSPPSWFLLLVWLQGRGRVFGGLAVWWIPARELQVIKLHYRSYEGGLSLCFRSPVSTAPSSLARAL